MECIADELDNLTRLTRMISSQFGEQCEVVLHDLTKGYESTIVAIENGHITGRRVGDCDTNIDLERLAGKTENTGDVYNYLTKTKNGRLLRSSTLYLRDEEGKIVGSICINFDITKLLTARGIISEITMFPEDTVSSPEFFANNVSELLDFYIAECKKMTGKPAPMMNKAEKIDIIRYLDNHGAFLITKAGDRICEYLEISKYTLYNYLDEARKFSGS